jgi:fermentation-respiration switch protein FrsA (DUF1100 family)
MEEDQMKEESNKLCSGKAILAIIIFAIAIVACVVVIVVLVLKTGNNMNSYYLSDIICEKDEFGNDVCYRKINVNMEHYISELSEKVVRTHVRYENRYGIELAADLYTPKDLDKSKKYAGIIIGPPYGGVKEQGPSVYANQLAMHNYVCLAFDPSFNGESGGKKRKVSSSDFFVEDFSAGVDYLGTLSYIDRERIGGIGICGSGGFLLGAAAIDSRIRAVIAVVMYDIPKINHNESDWDNILNNLNKTRWADAENGKQECIDFYKSDRVYYNDTLPSFPQGLEFDSQWKLFYTTERGHHPRSTGGFTTTSQFSLANLQVTDNIDKIKSPILFITSDQAHSFNYTIDKYNYLTKNVSKQNVFMINVTDAEHIDFYDKIDKIPFEEIVDFLDTNLTNNK